VVNRLREGEGPTVVSPEDSGRDDSIFEGLFRKDNLSFEHAVLQPIVLALKGLDFKPEHLVKLHPDYPFWVSRYTNAEHTELAMRLCLLHVPGSVMDHPDRDQFARLADLINVLLVDLSGSRNDVKRKPDRIVVFSWKKSEIHSSFRHRFRHLSEAGNDVVFKPWSDVDDILMTITGREHPDDLQLWIGRDPQVQAAAEGLFNIEAPPQAMP
jgi:hypothetical protein